MTNNSVRRSTGLLLAVAAAVVLGLFSAAPASAGPQGSIQSFAGLALQPVDISHNSQLTTAAFAGTTNQRWKTVGAAGQPAGTLNIKLLADQSLCLARFSNLNGSSVRVRTCDGTANQLWMIVPSGSLGGSNYIDPATFGASTRVMTDEGSVMRMRPRAAGAVNQLWS
jgi:hypothetical protein